MKTIHLMRRYLICDNAHYSIFPVHLINYKPWLDFVMYMNIYHTLASLVNFKISPISESNSR